MSSLEKVVERFRLEFVPWATKEEECCPDYIIENAVKSVGIVETRRICYDGPKRSYAMDELEHPRIYFVVVDGLVFSVEQIVRAHGVVRPTHYWTDRNCLHLGNNNFTAVIARIKDKGNHLGPIVLGEHEVFAQLGDDMCL